MSDELTTDTYACWECGAIVRIHVTQCPKCLNNSSLMARLGFRKERCVHCKSRLGQSGVCLNGCSLPGHLYHKLHNTGKTNGQS